MGINNDTHIVVYDNNPNFGFYSAGRVWWIFKVCIGAQTSLYHYTNLTFVCVSVRESGRSQEAI